MMNFSELIPHGVCLAWQPGLVALQAVSDALIALAYFSIPAALLVVLRRRRDLMFRPVFGLFAAFILLCGTTHVMGVVTLWVPLYWLDGVVKATTAAVSLVTAVLLWWLLPAALTLTSPEQLRAANAALAAGIAERDAVAAQLRASEARLERFYARTPAPLHATDSDGRLVAVNDRWLALFGATRAAAIGRPLTDFYAPETRPEVEATLDALRAGAEPPARASRRLLRADGEIRDAEAAFEVERDDTGRVAAVLVVLTDVTARKQAEAALAASEAQLRQAQKMEAVGQLTGGIAHDFNNLLQAVLGSLELLGADPALSDTGRRRVDLATTAAHRGARLVSQLLSFSRQQTLEPQCLEPAAVVAGIDDLLRRTCGDSARLDVVPGEGIWPVQADANMLEAALLNLTINARDAVGADGQVTISFANRTLSAASARSIDAAMAPGDYVAITVADNGAGMPAAVQARAFEPFFTTKPVGAGTGLGLSQCYGFARQSDGAMLLQSAPGAGTRATILLPRSSAAVPAPVVVMAEDDPLLRATVIETLTADGFRVVAAEDAGRALAMLEGCASVALLFTDVSMPGGPDGVDLALAARARWPLLPVLFSSGRDDDPALARWPERPDLLAKPYKAAALLARVRAALATGVRAPGPRTAA